MTSTRGQRTGSQNFRPTALTSRVAPLLRMLRDGHYPAKAARLLGWDKRLVHYYVRKLAGMGWIRREVRSAGSFYQLLQPGQNFLATFEKRASSARFVRLEHCGWQYPVLEEPRVPIEWRKVVAMKNWNQYVGSCCGLTIVRNPRGLVIFADALEGENPFELLALARDECDRLAGHLEGRFQMKLGRPTPLGNPEWAVLDPVSEQLTRFSGKISTPLGRMDRSWRRGEIDWKDPRAAYDYLMMPIRLARIETILAELLQARRDGQRRMGSSGGDEDMRRYL